MPRAGYGEPNNWLTCIMVDPDAFGATPEDDPPWRSRRTTSKPRPTWKPLHLQPLFADTPTIGGSVAAGIFEQGLCLPERLDPLRRGSRARGRGHRAALGRRIGSRSA